MSQTSTTVATMPRIAAAVRCRTRMRRATLTAALLVPPLAARAVVALLRPREQAEPLPVRAEDHFAPEDLARARAFRRPQPLLALGGMAVDTAVLVALLRRPGL